MSGFVLYDTTNVTSPSTTGNVCGINFCPRDNVSDTNIKKPAIEKVYETLV